jgi:cytochrome c
MRKLFHLALGASLVTVCASVPAQGNVLDVGKKAYAECTACHAVEKGSNGVGPTLFGVVGSRAAEVDGFRFSGPMKRSGIVWTAENLDKYLADPQTVIPGNRMPYSGMPDAGMRAALIRYLETLK